jgi:uncharacterized phage-associated protein
VAAAVIRAANARSDDSWRPPVLVTRDREKLINAVLFFARETENLGKIKLFKLLYLLDFEHYRQTGKTVTGLEYSAWKFGPVPTDLMQEWEELEPDFARAIDVVPKQVYDYCRESVEAKSEFDDSHFTKRELRLMESLAERYRKVFSPRMIDVTHAENGAWAKVWNEGQGNYEKIPYELSLADDDPNRDAIIESARDYEALNRASKN